MIIVRAWQYEVQRNVTRGHESGIDNPGEEDATGCGEASVDELSAVVGRWTEPIHIRRREPAYLGWPQKFLEHTGSWSHTDSTGRHNRMISIRHYQSRSQISDSLLTSST